MTATATESARPVLSESERAALLASVAGWIRQQVKDAKIPARDRDDAEQELSLEVWKASPRFDPARGVAFTTFTTGICRRKLSDLKRDAVRRCNPVGIPEDSYIEAPAEHDDGAEVVSPEAARDLAALAAPALPRLKKSQRELLALFAEGLSIDQIADRLSRKTSLVEIATRRLARRLLKSGAVPPELAERFIEWQRLDAQNPARKVAYSAGKEWKPKGSTRPAGGPGHAVPEVVEQSGGDGEANHLLAA